MSNHWMVCEVADRGQRDKPCLFHESTGMKRGDPPRCIRHGALLFSDSTLNGMSRVEAGRLVRQRHEEARL